jgi:hypothetical protein
MDASSVQVDSASGPETDSGTLPRGDASGNEVDSSAAADSSADSSSSRGDSSSNTDTGSPGDNGADTGSTSDTGVDTGSSLDAGSFDSAACPGSNLADDPANCGTCFHNCLGGSCSSGQCQAFVLVGQQYGAKGLAQDDTGLYWATQQNLTVMKANKDGGSMATLANLSSMAVPWDVAVDDTNVYWTDFDGTTNASGSVSFLYSNGSVEGCPKEGGDGGFSYVTTATLSGAQGLAVDGTNVYWAESNAGALGRVSSVLSSSGQAPEYIATNLGSPTEVALDTDSAFFNDVSDVYWMLKSDTAVNGPDKTPTGTITTIYEDGADDFYDEPTGITTDGTNVYWTVFASTGGLIEYSPVGATDSSQTTQLATNEVNPLMIAVDADNVYWTAAGDFDDNGNSTGQGYVAMCPKAGCPSAGPTHLTPANLHSPFAITVDSTAIYFTVTGNTSIEGSVMKIAK